MFTNHEKNLLLTAIMFYTRIPVTKDLPYSAEMLNQSRKYFTFIGLIIGLLVSAVFLIASTVFPASVAVIVSMIASVLATGAFHEDGFADTCDGLGGGWSAEQVITIMKDSRIGTYGTVGLTSILALKCMILIELSNEGLWLWCLYTVAAHMVSRLHSSRLIKHHQYVQDIDKSKIKPIANEPLSQKAETFGLLIALVPCAIMLIDSIAMTISALLVTFIVSSGFMQYCSRRIGGYTGDILGAIQQLTEVCFLLTCLAFI